MSYVTELSNDESRRSALKNLNYWRLTPDSPVLNRVHRQEVYDIFMYHLRTVDTWINNKKTIVENAERLFNKFYAEFSQRLTLHQMVAFFAEWEKSAISKKPHELLQSFTAYYYDIAQQVENIEKERKRNELQNGRYMLASEYAEKLRKEGCNDAFARMMYRLFPKEGEKISRESPKQGVQSVGSIMFAE